MSRSPKRVVLMSSLAFAAVALTGSAAFAGGDLPADAAAAYRFEVRALGTRVGEAVLSIGKTEKIGGIDLRAVTIEAKTEGLGAKVFKTATTSTSWVDGAWYPIRARWDAEIPTGKRLVKARYDGKRVRGEDKRDGKTKAKLDRRLSDRPTDMISAFAWLLHMDLAPGTVLKSPVYDGLRVFELEAKVGEARDLHVPVGLRKAVPIQVTVTLGKFQRQLVYWVDPVDRTPYKVSFQYGMLGSVDAVLTASKRA